MRFGLRSWTNSRNETALFFQFVSAADRIERDGVVEVGKTDDQKPEDQYVAQVGGLIEVVGDEVTNRVAPHWVGRIARGREHVDDQRWKLQKRRCEDDRDHARHVQACFLLNRD